jgi:DnaJ like chaperone protein
MPIRNALCFTELGTDTTILAATSRQGGAINGAMSIWSRFAELFTLAASAALNSVVEALRTVFEGDPETRRRVAFSIAMIALSAKMAKADGVVTPPEVTAFEQIFSVPEADRRHVERLYALAQEDVAGFEAYAKNMARLCGDGARDCPVLEDILDGLFHIAKADGVVHEREFEYLSHVADIFGLSEARFERLSARHVQFAAKAPHAVLGIAPEASLAEARKAWLKLVRENHPDIAMARGLPEEFIAIANARLADINAAFETLERAHRAA